MSRLLLSLSLLFLISVAGACDQKSRTEAAEKERQRLDSKRLDQFYEMEFVKCVNDLGPERCHIIQETGFRMCRNQETVDANGNTMNECIDNRFKDRFKTLPKPPQAKPLPEEPYVKPEVPAE